MTRIFEALKKSRGQAAALPFPPVDPPVLRPAPVLRPLAPSAPGAPTEAGPAPRVDLVTTAPLPAEVARELTALRIGLESALEGKPRRVIMFLSALHGEGVSTVAMQFASLVAADGRGRSLLLDLHARDAAPPVRSAGGRQPWPGGRSGASRPDAETPAGRGGHPLGLAVLTDEIRGAGGWTPALVRTFLATVSSRFDWVIVDGPPVLQAPESVDLAPLVDGVALVVRAGHAKRPVVSRAVDLLRKSGVRILGCVLNRRRFEIPGFIYRRI